MPRTSFANAFFDPSLCPLLAGLSPAEQEHRMRTDPMIRACIRSVEAGTPHGCTTEKPAAEPQDAENASPAMAAETGA